MESPKDAEVSALELPLEGRDQVRSMFKELLNIS